MTRQRRNLKTKSIYDDFESVFLKWNSNLSEEIIKQNQEIAINIIMYIGLHGNDNDKHLINQKAKCFYDAINFLSKNDINAILITFSKIFETEKCDRSKIMLQLTSIEIKIHVLNLNDFYSVAITSLNYLPSSIKFLNETTKEHVVYLFVILFDFMKVQNSYAIYVTSTAYMLLKKHCMDISMDEFEGLVRTVGRTFMAISSNTKAIEYCDKMTHILIKSWPVTKRIREFKNLEYSYTWDAYDCRLAVYLLNLWSTEPVTDLLISLAPRICSMLTEKNISSSVMKVLEAALPHLSLSMWNKTFVPILIGLMPNEFDEQK
ncbi:hypothetical protein ILUMI_20431 [Ignelater luminosus]|uniref:Uncharacterized protein n=1 Tax=Ignelater luminosus TaxID=2038154 RepID=A0A8K0CKM8_IGNLU|nr:hypothetical protein ILUMI_20431 [Ignelater luminosus]